MNTKQNKLAVAAVIVLGLIGSRAEAKSFPQTLKPISSRQVTLDKYRFDHKNITIVTDPGPQMVSHECLNCDSDAPVVRIIFNEDIAQPAPQALKIFAYDLSEGAASIPAPTVLYVSYGADGKDVLFFLSTAFQSNVNYRFYVPEGLIEDLSGNAMTTAIAWHDDGF